MLKSVKGTENGIDIKTFEKDKIYHIGEGLFKSFKEVGAIILEEDKAKGKVESNSKKQSKSKKVENNKAIQSKDLQNKSGVKDAKKAD